MKKTAKVFHDTICLEGEEILEENGTIYFNSFSTSTPSLLGGKDSVSQRGIMKTDSCGDSVFVPYHSKPSACQTSLFATVHGRVKESPNAILVNFTLPKALGLDGIRTALFKENMEIRKFLR